MSVGEWRLFGVRPSKGVFLIGKSRICTGTVLLVVFEALKFDSFFNCFGLSARKRREYDE